MLLLIFFGIHFIQATLQLNSKILDWLSFGFFFSLGALLKKENFISKMQLYKGISIAGCLIIIIIGTQIETSITDPFAKLLIGSGVTGILILAFINNSRGFSWLQYCGKYSLVIYMIHGFSNNIAIRIALNTHISLDIIIITIATLLQIFLAIGVITLWKKIRFMKWLEYIFYPKQLFRKTTE